MQRNPRIIHSLLSLAKFCFYILGGRYIPKYDTISEGFTSLKMISRTEMMFPPSPQTGSKTPTHPYTWSNTPCMDRGDTEYDIGNNSNKT